MEAVGGGDCGHQGLPGGLVKSTAEEGRLGTRRTAAHPVFSSSAPTAENEERNPLSSHLPCLLELEHRDNGCQCLRLSLS